jgi:hypothetical protein
MTESGEADDAAGPLTRPERLRRVVVLCESFTRNLAYFRVGHDYVSRLSDAHPHVSFWVQVTNNFLDICVLEWCKLFGERDRKQYGWGQHGWRAIVGNHDSFEEGLLTDLNITEEQFCDLAGRVRNYRDKFVAHLDSSLVMMPPILDNALKSLRFYHKHVVEQEAAGGVDLRNRANTTVKMSDYYRQCIAEATEIYSQIALGKV